MPIDLDGYDGGLRPAAGVPIRGYLTRHLMR